MEDGQQPQLIRGRLQLDKTRLQKFTVRVRGENLGVPGPESQGEFIIEHYWGYTRRGPAQTDGYRVEHPKWELTAAENLKIDVDFRCTYGDDFAFLNESNPFLVLLAKGSEISVLRGSTIK